MALLDRRVSDGRRIEVRSAGRSLRLYVDGVFHTAWNPGRTLTGAIWDPIALAALAASARPIRRVLLLGLGGGAAVQILRAHVKPAAIVAVERCPEIADIAANGFGAAGEDLEIVVGDAAEFLRGDRTRWDAILDDVFGEAGGEPLRAAGGAPWWRHLASRLEPGGALVVNFTDGRDLRESPLVRDPWFRGRFEAASKFRCRGFHNEIAVLGGPGAAAARLGATILATPSVAALRGRDRLRVQLAGMWPLRGLPRHARTSV